MEYTGKVLMRDHTQVGPPVRVGYASLQTTNAQSVSGYNTGIPFPNGPDYSLLLHPVYLRQENGNLRGVMPGFQWVLNEQPLGHGAIVDNVQGYPGRKFILGATSVLQNANVTRVAFDITGPWY
jgi:hypothetical protein